jgi:hypothetical protein
MEWHMAGLVSLPLVPSHRRTFVPSYLRTLDPAFAARSRLGSPRRLGGPTSAVRVEEAV